MTWMSLKFKFCSRFTAETIKKQLRFPFCINTFCNSFYPELEMTSGKRANENIYPVQVLHFNDLSLTTFPCKPITIISPFFYPLPLLLFYLIFLVLDKSKIFYKILQIGLFFSRDASLPCYRALPKCPVNCMVIKQTRILYSSQWF